MSTAAARYTAAKQALALIRTLLGEEVDAAVIIRDPASTDSSNMGIRWKGEIAQLLSGAVNVLNDAADTDAEPMGMA